MNYLETHYFYMNLLIEKSLSVNNEVPVTALTTFNNQIISIKSNEKELKNDPTSHAEIEVIRDTALKLGNWRLKEVSLYVTLEPCPMCAGAIIQSRIKTLIFGAYDNIYGAFGSKINMKEIMNSDIEIIGGIKESECSNLMKNFFDRKRKNEY